MGVMLGRLWGVWGLGGKVVERLEVRRFSLILILVVIINRAGNSSSSSSIVGVEVDRVVVCKGTVDRVAAAVINKEEEEVGGSRNMSFRTGMGQTLVEEDSNRREGRSIGNDKG